MQTAARSASLAWQRLIQTLFGVHSLKSIQHSAVGKSCLGPLPADRDDTRMSAASRHQACVLLPNDFLASLSSSQQVFRDNGEEVRASENRGARSWRGGRILTPRESGGSPAARVNDRRAGAGQGSSVAPTGHLPGPLASRAERAWARPRERRGSRLDANCPAHLQRGRGCCAPSGRRRRGWDARCPESQS